MSAVKPIAARTVGTLLGLTLLLLGACSSAPVAVTDHDPSFDFTAVRTVAILPVDRSVTPVAVLSDMQINRMNWDIGDELQRKGMTLVNELSEADLLISWHLVTQQRTDVRTYNSSIRYSNCWNCAPSTNVRVQQFTQGTLIVDGVDPVRMQSVWRSVLEDRLREQPDAERAAEARRSAVAAVFHEFPPL